MAEPPVLCLPGTLTPPSIYAGVLARLGGAVDTLDWMAEAPLCTLETAARHIAETVRAGSEGPVVLVGHSTGGAIAAVAALDHPDVVAGVVLINSGPHMREHASVEGMLARLREGGDEEMWERFALQNVRQGAPRKWIEEMVAYSRDVGGATAASILHSQWSADLLSWERTSPVPAAVLHGLEDVKRSVADARAWSGVFPAAEVTALRGCGHTPPLEAPEAVADAIARMRAVIGARSG